MELNYHPILVCVGIKNCAKILLPVKSILHGTCTKMAN